MHELVLLAGMVRISFPSLWDLNKVRVPDRVHADDRFPQGIQEVISDNLRARGCVAPPATIEAIDASQAELKLRLPAALASLLREADGASLNDGTVIYSTTEIVERNQTLEVAEYAPGYVAIADDSGDQVYVMSLDEARPQIFQVDQGSMHPDDMEVVANDLPSWLNVAKT